MSFKDRLTRLEGRLPADLDAMCCVESQAVRHYLTREEDPERPELPLLDSPCVKTGGPRCARGLELAALWGERRRRLAARMIGLDETML